MWWCPWYQTVLLNVNRIRKKSRPKMRWGLNPRNAPLRPVRASAYVFVLTRACTVLLWHCFEALLRNHQLDVSHQLHFEVVWGTRQPRFSICEAKLHEKQEHARFDAHILKHHCIVFVWVVAVVCLSRCHRVGIMRVVWARWGAAA